MNSKFVILTFLIIFNACGVKGHPISAPGTELKDWFGKYTNQEKDSEDSQGEKK